jgi:imidazoleglycerol-phosphate dehydratase
MKLKRIATIIRSTRETQIQLRLNLDGAGKARIRTSIPFIDHMLDLFARHGMFDLDVRAKGDRKIDDHHLVEDLGIALGEAIAKALGDKKGIVRFGNFLLPMDETLSYVAIDLSNRPHFVFKVKWMATQIGKFDGLLLEHFFESAAMGARMNLHMALKYGKHPHHIGESLFKGFARALAQAVAIDPRVKGVPSTKGKL